MSNLSYDEMKMLYNFMMELPSAKVLDEVQRMRGLSAQEFIDEMNVLKNRMDYFHSSVDKRDDMWGDTPVGTSKKDGRLFYL